MPVQDVRADVIDLRTDQPERTDEFVVDTNSWKELTYTRIREPKVAYQNYIRRAVTEGAMLYSTGTTLVELASVIEKNEWELYKRSGGALLLKDFRHECAAERASVLEEISAAWQQITQVARLIDLHLNQPATERILRSLQTCCIDGYDTTLVEAMTRRNVFSIISDDGDFATVQDIRLFTANAHVLSVARRQGRLRTRN